MKDFNISDLVASVKAEAEEAKDIEKTASLRGFAKRISGEGFSKEAQEAQSVATTVAQEIGQESLSLSVQLEKVASEMEEAETIGDIVKIASDLGNSDLAHISTIASKLADVVYADLQNKFEA